MKVDGEANDWSLTKQYTTLSVQDKEINIEEHPTLAVLDLGCTRAMGSRPAVTRFVKAIRKLGYYVEFLPSNAKFSFANSQTAQCREMIRVWFPTTRWSSTCFDIVEV